MGGSETHTTTVVGRIVLTSFFSAIQMMMRLLGLHYSRWQLRTFSHAVSMHPLLYYHIVPIRRYVDDSHFQLGFHSLTHVHFITEHKEIKHFSFIREYKLFWYTHVPVVQLFGGIPITLGGNAFKGLEHVSFDFKGMLGMNEKCVRCGKWQWILTVLVLRFTFAAPRFSALFWLLTAL